MRLLQNRSLMIALAMMLAMAATRFNHFGSSVVLPDASWALYFLAGMYLGRMRTALLFFIALTLEAVLVDYYAIVVQSMSDWCVTNAYGFMIFAYAALWYGGRWFARHHTYSVKSLLGLFATVAGASLVAFVISNVSFYLFSGRYANMSAADYAVSVQQYLGTYVIVAVMYVAVAVAIEMSAQLVLKGRTDQNTRPV